ncbi:hypothetical protein BED33_14865 [Yersinia enterocolitica]|nr:hypothetical protein BED33_14865 [Yersinia enterocolitica]
MYIYPIETKSRCGRQELLAAPVRKTGCSLTKRGTKAEMLINPRDGFLPDSLGDQREVGFGMWCSSDGRAQDGRSFLLR